MHRTLGRATVIAATIAPILGAQQVKDTTKAVPLAAITTTATRNPRSTFDTPQPITLIDSVTLREKLTNNIADAFRDVAGLDANGVGPNQRRPEIRLQRGQRILLLEDGLRLNNSRRQQDFGDIPALAGSSIERVEVVRGPSSVLYGTDAIGGVVNIISARPTLNVLRLVTGAVTYRASSAGQINMPIANFTTRFGKLGLRANASYRDAADYQAPKGKFGNINLTDETRVFDSGVRDQSYNLAGEYDLGRATELFSRIEFYNADHAGFGWIDPAKLGANQPKIQITYPDQAFARYTLGYRAKVVTTPFFNRVEFSAYTQNNRRHLNNYVFVPITPTANVTTRSFNYTNLQTLGGRLELAKQLGAHIITYGVDGFRDRSNNTDTSMTTVIGFGPPVNQASNVPSVPNAIFSSVGAFAQAELNPVARFSATLGGRWQDIHAETRATKNVTRPLVSNSKSTGVYSLNTLFRVTDDANLIASIARGFRSPNLVERFFEGPAPEGNGFQRANPDLRAETSVNVDLGARYRRGLWFAESFLFRNDIHDGIRAVATGNTVAGQPEFKNQNISKLRVDGLEATTGMNFLSGITSSVNFTRFVGKNVSDPAQPIGDSYSSKWVGELGFRAPSGRYALGYTLRYQGEQKDVIVGTNPIGSTIPAFAVHTARASVRLPVRGSVANTLSLVVDNIGNKLYSETPNASFFRPEPGRNISLALTTSF